MPPVVSVIIPAYNQARYVRQAVESVLAQSYSSHEVIVVNDGSTDDTAAVLAGFGPRIRVVTQPNAGLAAARNRGVGEAKGGFVGFLDADDWWHPDALAVFVAQLQAHPEVEIVCGGWTMVDEEGRELETASVPPAIQEAMRADLFGTLTLHNRFPVHAALARMKALDLPGPFDTGLRAVEDWDLWLRLAARGARIGFVSANVAFYRRHVRGMSQDFQRMETAMEMVLNKLFANPETARRLAGLEQHARLGVLSHKLSHCARTGADDELLSCAREARRLQRRARPSDLARVAAAMTPDELTLCQWRATRRLWATGRRLRALRELLTLAAAEPRWVARTMAASLRRKFSSPAGTPC